MTNKTILTMAFIALGFIIPMHGGLFAADAVVPPPPPAKEMAVNGDMDRDIEMKMDKGCASGGCHRHDHYFNHCYSCRDDDCGAFWGGYRRGGIVGGTVDFVTSPLSWF